jgi:capsular exopolysaccharide synthesis family protein
VTKLPSRRPDDHLPMLAPHTEVAQEESEFTLTDLGALIRQSVWFMLACALLAGTAAVIYVRRLVPVYEARVSLRIQDKQSNLPGMFPSLSGTSELTSEMQVLMSRTLVEEATRQLALQVRLVKPAGVARDTLLQVLDVSPVAVAGKYRLVRQADGHFDVTDDVTGKSLSRVHPGDSLSLPGVSFRLAGPAKLVKEITIRVSPLRDAILATQGALEVARVSREADVLSIQFRDRDPDLVWRVPNALVQVFMKRREDTEKLQAASQVRFLRGQIDTLAVQLRASEEELKRFRESARVVNPSEEADKQIGRLVELESGRSTIEAERSSLAKLLAQVDSERAAGGTSPQSPYRRLFASPSLFQSQAASQMITALTQVEDQRVTLLTRRTEQDPEVQRLTARIAELEGQLGAIARTYLQGLTDQVKSRDSTIAGFSRQLAALPGKELEFARLERTPTVLKDMYTLLQTRLKEAEITEAAQSANVDVIDPAIPPRAPIGSRKKLIVLGALIAGLLAGLSVGAIRQFLDHTVRTRADVIAASGLPVLALIPRIAHGGRKQALIANHNSRPARGTSPRSTPSPPDPKSLPAAPGRKIFSFLSVSDPSPETAQSATQAPEIHMTVSDLGSAIAEAYCILQTNVAFSDEGKTVKTLVLTSALPGEGKTTTAVNLAIALTQRGLSILLIDADLRRGRVHELFGVSRAPGLCEVLQGGQAFEQARRIVQVGDARELTVLPAGSLTSSPPALVGSQRMRVLLDHLKETYDLVIIDTPPINILTDAALLGRQADGVVVVVRAGVTDSGALAYAMGQLNHVRAPALGVVLNDIVLKRDGTYDGVYYYAAYASYTATEDEKS